MKCAKNKKKNDDIRKKLGARTVKNLQKARKLMRFEHLVRMRQVCEQHCFQRIFILYGW